MSFADDLIKRLTGKRGAEERWNARWADKDFDWMGRLTELAHYSIVAGYALELKPKGKVIDLGCGDGVLHGRLHPDSYSSYIGLDFAEAVGRAQARVNPRSTFVAGDMRTYVPPEKLDTIIFNEVITYVEDPMGEFKRYEAFLAPDGIFIVSTHRKEISERIWAGIVERYAILDQVVVKNGEGVEWIVGAFKPKP